MLENLQEQIDNFKKSLHNKAVEFVAKIKPEFKYWYWKNYYKWCFRLSRRLYGLRLKLRKD